MTEADNVFIHPVSGEMLRVSEDALAQAILEGDKAVGALHRAMAPLREKLAELRGPVSLPRRRYQTATQQRVCPSCGKTYGEDRFARKVRGA